jgi:hypothetical protein
MLAPDRAEQAPAGKPGPSAWLGAGKPPRDAGGQGSSSAAMLGLPPCLPPLASGTVLPAWLCLASPSQLAAGTYLKTSPAEYYDERLCSAGLRPAFRTRSALQHEVCSGHWLSYQRGRPNLSRS